MFYRVLGFVVWQAASGTSAARGRHLPSRRTAPRGSWASPSWRSPSQGARRGEGLTPS